MESPEVIAVPSATLVPQFTILLSTTARGARLARHLAAEQLASWGVPYSTDTACAAVLVLGLKTPRTGSFAQLGFLIVAAFLLVNKVYSPQYVLWLLPLAVIARPRWRDLLIWQSCELFYFGAVWLYLGQFTASGTTGGNDPLYVTAIVVRVAGDVADAGVA